MAGTVTRANSTASDPCWINSDIAVLLKRIADKKDYIKSFKDLPVDHFVLTPIDCSYGQSAAENIMRYILEAALDRHTPSSSASLSGKDFGFTIGGSELTRQDTFGFKFGKNTKIHLEEGDEITLIGNVRSSTYKAGSSSSYNVVFVDKSYWLFDDRASIPDAAAWKQDGHPASNPRVPLDYPVPAMELWFTYSLPGTSHITFTADSETLGTVTGVYKALHSHTYNTVSSRWTAAMSGRHNLRFTNFSRGGKLGHAHWCGAVIQYPAYKGMTVRCKVTSITYRDITQTD